MILERLQALRAQQAATAADLAQLEAEAATLALQADQASAAAAERAQAAAEAAEREQLARHAAAEREREKRQAAAQADVARLEKQLRQQLWSAWETVNALQPAATAANGGIHSGRTAVLQRNLRTLMALAGVAENGAGPVKP